MRFLRALSSQVLKLFTNVDSYEGLTFLGHFFFYLILKEYLLKYCGLELLLSIFFKRLSFEIFFRGLTNVSCSFCVYEN